MTSSNQAARILGVDVVKDKLGVCESQRQLRKEIPNSITAVTRQIVQRIDDPDKTFVVCEATGGDERTLVKTWQQAGISVDVANPWQVRQFGKGLDRLEKTDPIDAGLLRKFGETAELQPTQPLTEEQERQQALVRRREFRRLE